jgi:predicted transcriptional regulator
MRAGIIDYMNTSIKQPSIRVNLAAKQKLDRLQKQTDLSQPALLDRAIDLLELELQAKQFAADLADLVADAEALRKYQEVAAIFEGAASDGLKKD